MAYKFKCFTWKQNIYLEYKLCEDTIYYINCRERGSHARGAYHTYTGYTSRMQEIKSETWGRSKHKNNEARETKKWKKGELAQTKPNYH